MRFQISIFVTKKNFFTSLFHTIQVQEFEFELDLNKERKV